MKKCTPFQIVTLLVLATGASACFESGDETHLENQAVTKSQAAQTGEAADSAALFADPTSGQAAAQGGTETQDETAGLEEMLDGAAEAPLQPHNPPTIGADQKQPGHEGHDPSQQEEQAKSGSSLEFENNVFDLGKIAQKPYDVFFPFKVKGDDPITITKIDISCGCTKAVVEVDGAEIPVNTPLAPGTEGRIYAVFDATKYSNRKSSTIDIRGNGANMPKRLTIQSFIRPTFEVRPQVIRFPEVQKLNLKTQPPERVVRVNAVEPFEIKDWVRIAEGFTIEDTGRVETDTEGAGISRFLKIGIDPDAPAKMLFGTFEAETSLGKNLQITAQANVIGPVRYFPRERVFFNMVNKGSTPTKGVRIEPSGQDFEVPEPTIHLEGSKAYQAFVHVDKPGKRYSIRIQMKEDAELGRHTATMKISYPEESGLESHEVFISGVVRDRN